MNDNLLNIDKVLNVQVDFEKHLNECNALHHLKIGLVILYNSVKPYEVKVDEYYKSQEITMIGGFGNDPNIGVPNEIYAALPCYFHWFGTSLCNYARLAGLIVSKEKGLITEDDLTINPNRTKIRNKCDDYIKSVPEISDVLKWRNKVAAHFALTDPRSDDNIATMEASVMFPVGFDHGKYRTGSYTFVRGEGDTNHISEIPRWSLTETFEALTHRYWPDITFNK